MAVRLSIDASELRTKIGEAVEGMEDRLKDLTPVTKAAAEGLRTVIDDAFEDSRTPWGVPWDEPSRAWTDRKQKEGRSTKPNIYSGAMRNRIATEGTTWGVKAGSSPTTPYAVVRQQDNPFIPQSNAHLASGPMAKWTEKFKRSVIRYILTGKKR